MVLTWSCRLRTNTATCCDKLRALLSWSVFWSSSRLSRLRVTSVYDVHTSGTGPTTKSSSSIDWRMRPRRCRGSPAGRTGRLDSGDRAGRGRQGRHVGAGADRPHHFEDGDLTLLALERRLAERLH